MKKEMSQVMDKGRSEIRAAIGELSHVKYGEDKDIPTLAFLHLSNLLIFVLGKVVPTMAVLRQDIQRNIEKLEEIYVSDPSIYFTLGEILKKEMDEGSSRKPGSCSKSVVWLTRSISFGVDMMGRLEKDSELSFEQIVEEAYKSTLKPWHGWISSAAYKVALKLIPERNIFMSLLVGRGEDYAGLKGDMQKLISLTNPFLDVTNALLRKYRLDKLKST